MIDITETPLPPAQNSDPVDALALAAQQPRTRRPKANLAKWRARFVVLVMAGAAAGGGLAITHAKSQAALQLPLDTVTLTAQPIPIEPAQAGQLTDVLVKAQERVHAGEVLARMTVMRAKADGKLVKSTATITAPSDGIVSDDPQPVGSALAPGQALVDMYDPHALTLVASVPLDELQHVSAGMTATLQADGLPTTVHAKVQRIVPRVGNSVPGIPSDEAEIVLQPQEDALVAQLLPGLQFHGKLDTTSGRQNAKGGVYVGR